jgi:hypothetical protein
MQPHVFSRAYLAGLFVGCLLLLASLAWSAPPDRYTITDLGPLQDAFPQSIDDAGIVVGYTSTGAAILYPTRTQLDMGGQDGFSLAWGSAGSTIVGYGDFAQGRHAARWRDRAAAEDLGAAAEDLGAAAGAEFRAAQAVNAHGVIVGQGDAPPGAHHRRASGRAGCLGDRSLGCYLLALERKVMRHEQSDMKNERYLDQLEFVLDTPSLPDGCLCDYAPTETLGLIQYVWAPQCPVHGEAP